MYTGTGIFAVNEPILPVNHLPCGVVAGKQCGCCHPFSLEYKTEPSSRCYQLKCGLTTRSLWTCFAPYSQQQIWPEVMQHDMHHPRLQSIWSRHRLLKLIVKIGAEPVFCVLCYITLRYVMLSSRMIRCIFFKLQPDEHNTERGGCCNGKATDLTQNAERLTEFLCCPQFLWANSSIILKNRQLPPAFKSCNY